MEQLPLATASELAIAKGLSTPSVHLKHVKLQPLLPVNEFDEEAQLGALVEEECKIVFNEEGSLGLQVEMFSSRGNKYILVSGIRKGSQAETYFSSSSNLIVGSEIVSVGKVNLAGIDESEALTCIANSPRPTLLRLRYFVPNMENADNEEPMNLVKVTFFEQHLGPRFEPSEKYGPSVTEINGYSKTDENIKSVAEKSGKVFPGQILYSLNGQRVLGQSFPETVHLLKTALRPVEFGLLNDPLISVNFNTPPIDLIIEYARGCMVVTDIVQVLSPLKEKLQRFDILETVNNLQLPCHVEDYQKDIQMTTATTMFPLKLQFLRNSKTSSDRYAVGESFMTSARIKVKVENVEEMPFIFKPGKDGRPFIDGFKYVDGPGRLSRKIEVGMVLHSIDGKELDVSCKSPSSCLDLIVNGQYPLMFTFKKIPEYVNLQKLLKKRVSNTCKS